MKRVCKSVSIEDCELIRRAVLDCLHPAKKRRRGDTRRLFARLLRIPTGRAGRALCARDELYYIGVDLVVDMLAERIHHRRLGLRPVYHKFRIDPGSRKLRKISILSIEQLMLDHVAVAGMEELAPRIGEYQISSIPGRGTAYGKRAIERWLREKSSRYAVKLDIKNFYGSVDRKKLMAWLHRHIKNRALLWLLGQLIYTAPEGIAIGSFLSQTLANIYLSDLYHLAMERCVSKRGTRQVRHALFQMDDMLLLGSNKRQLRYAAYSLIKKAGEMGLQIKPNWQVWRVTHEHPIDMLGYRFSPYRTTLRKRIFKFARRATIRWARAQRRTIITARLRRYRHSLRAARRLASYYGYIVSASCEMFIRRENARGAYSEAFQLISHHGTHILHTRTGARTGTAPQRELVHHRHRQHRTHGK